MLQLKLLIYYLSYLIWPYVLVILLCIYKNKKLPKIYYLILVIGLVLAYARFIEPKILIVKTTEVEIDKPLNKSVKIAVFSDTHFGIFKNAMSASRITQKVNKIGPDLILIPGDFLNEIHVENLSNALAGFKKLKAPVFAVTGNHDEGFPGPNYGNHLIDVLKANNINVVNNDYVDFSEQIRIVGLSDLWAGNYDLDINQNLQEKKINILLSHNPDISYKLQANKNIDLIVSGHTHGGQIRIPWLYKKMIPSKYDFDMGLYLNQNSYKVFVTSGTGMVGLPMRFLIPPRIDVLNIKMAR